MHTPHWIKDHIPHRKQSDTQETPKAKSEGSEDSSASNSIFDTLKETATKGKNAVSERLSQSIETVASVSSGATQSIKNHIESGVEAMSDGVKNVAEKVKIKHDTKPQESEAKAQPSESSETSSASSSIFDTLKETATKGKNVVSERLSQSIETVASVSSGATLSIKNHIESGVEAMSEGVKNVAEKVKIKHDTKAQESEADTQPSEKKVSFIGRIKQYIPHREKKKPVKSGIYLPVFNTPTRRWYSRPFILIGIAIAILAVTQAIIGLYETLLVSPILGSIYAVALIMVFVAAIIAILRERYASQSMTRCLECRASDNAQEALHLLEALPCNTASEVLPASSEWYKSVASCNDTNMVKSEYSRLVLEPFVDKGVAKVISTAGIQTAGLVVVSPFAIADMLIVMITSLSMMNKIAQCYGIDMTMPMRYRMYKTVLQNMSISGAAELTTDVVSQFGAGMTGILSARAGQAILAGRCIAKLGLQMAVECRPIEFTEDNRLSYGSIVKAITLSVKGKEDTSDDKSQSNGQETTVQEEK